MHGQLFSRSEIALFFTMVMAVMAVGGTLAGKLPGRFGGVATRSDNPKQYWLTLAGYYIAAIGLFAFYLHEQHAF